MNNEYIEFPGASLQYPLSLRIKCMLLTEIRSRLHTPDVLEGDRQKPTQRLHPETGLVNERRLKDEILDKQEKLELKGRLESIGLADEPKGPDEYPRPK